MHELSLAESVIDLVEDAARREGFVRVKTVFIQIGKLSCVAPEALRLALDIAAMSTCLDGAELEILAIAGEGECPVCRATVVMETAYVCCPQCGACPINIVRGMEMRVTELDVE